MNAQAGPIRRRLRIVFTCVLLLAVLVAFYVGTLFYIRARAYSDYDTLRAGSWPDWARRSEPIGLAVGGSTLRDGFGYMLVRVRRTLDPGGLGTPATYEAGTELKFTCRGYFPVLHRLLQDKRDVAPEP